MIIRVCYFTEQGGECAERLSSKWEDAIFQVWRKEVSLEQWTGECFQRRLPVLFIGACGIAVRMIAPYVRDKLFDSPVMVMDEKGRFVIPLLSGHMGGANRLAEKIASLMGAQAVITTATDVEKKFSVDVFAWERGLAIKDREGIKEISAKVLRGERITVAIDPKVENDVALFPEELQIVPFDTPYVDIRILSRETFTQNSDRNKNATIRLVTKEFILGVGCKKGKSFEELQAFLQKHCPYDMEQEVYALASIDLKAREEGLWGVAQHYHIPFVTFSAQELEAVQGDFEESDFVKSVTGVSNVCERAAVLLSAGGELVHGKIAEDGMTLAIACKKPEIRAGMCGQA